MLEFLNQIDTSVFLFFNGMHTPFLDRFMMLFTGRFIWIPMYAAILIVLLRTHGVKSAGIYVLAIALAITLTDQTCATFIRPMVERLRPSNLENPLSALTIVVDDYRGGSYGFPSCHSANSFALATFMAFLFPRRRMLMFISAGLHSIPTPAYTLAYTIRATYWQVPLSDRHSATSVIA